MNPQPDAWVGAVGMLVLVLGTAAAIKIGISNAKANPNPNPKNWDLFELGEVFDKPYYKPSPTNLMRNIDATRRKNTHERKS